MIDLAAKFPTRTLRKIEPSIPLGVCYIAAMLEQEGFTVNIIDNELHGYSHEILANKILEYTPSFVGFSVTSLSVYNAFKTAEFVKRKDPQIVTIFGGPHATVLPESTITNEYVDYVVVGEGELVLPNLLKIIINGHLDDKIKGVFSKDSFGQIEFLGNQELIHNLDILPFPARDLLDFTKYSRRDSLNVFPVDYMSSSRGCPFHCSFCSSSPYWQRKYRTRGSKNVVDEIELLQKNYGTKGIYFREDIFTLSKSHVRAICHEILRRNLDIVWECESKVGTVSKELLREMYSAGCRYIWFGIESGVDRILKMIRKGINIAQIRKTFEWCKEVRIKTGAAFVIGFPGETREDILKSYHFARELEPDKVNFQAYVGFPVSELYRKVVAEKMYFDHWNDVYILETNDLSFHEIIKLERTINARFLRTTLKKRFLYLAIQIKHLLKNPMYIRKLISRILYGIKLFFTR